jgi:hypothetical protein
MEADIDADPILKKSRTVRFRLAFLPEGRKWSSTFLHSADVSSMNIIFYFLDKYKRSIRKQKSSHKNLGKKPLVAQILFNRSFSVSALWYFFCFFPSHL